MTMVYRDGPREIQLSLKDYRPEDGLRIPHTWIWRAGGEPVEEFQQGRSEQLTIAFPNLLVDVFPEWLGWSPTAHVQRGSSQTARCASTGGHPGLSLSLLTHLLG